MTKPEMFIKRYRKNNTTRTACLAKSLLFLTLIVLLIPSVSAEVTNLQISPENPGLGDEVTISGTTDTNKIEATVDFTKTVPVSDGRYKYTVYDVKIPKGENTFRVIADGVENLKVDANKWWAPSLTSDASGGTASIGTSVVPSGTYKITISGDAQDDKSTVDLTIVASMTLTEGENIEIGYFKDDNFQFSYDTDPIPEGEFTLTVGSEVRTVTLGSSNSNDRNTEDSDSGSSSGGGSPGQTPDKSADNVKVTETEIRKMMSNILVKSKFNKESNPIKYINITSRIAALDIPIKVEVLKDTSTLVKNPPQGKVYKNLNIWVGYPGYATDDNIINSTVEFEVNTDWIENNNIDPESIVLMHYDEKQDEWNELHTEKLRETDSVISYQAHPNHFSPFAITGEQIQSKEDNKSENTDDSSSSTNNNSSNSSDSQIENNTTDNQNFNNTSNSTSNNNNTNKDDRNKPNVIINNTYLNFFVLIAVIGMLGAVLLMKRR